MGVIVIERGGSGEAKPACDTTRTSGRKRANILPIATGLRTELHG
jgi:hypothetical protein